LRREVARRAERAKQILANQSRARRDIKGEARDWFKVQTDALDALLDHASGSAEKHAKYMRDKVVPAMHTLRDLGDRLEVLTPHEIWPLPTYREMLFVK